MEQTLYVIKRGDEGGFVDKGGRKCLTISQAWMWSTEEAANKKLSAFINDVPFNGLMRTPQYWNMPIDGWKVIPVKLTWEDT